MSLRLKAIRAALAPLAALPALMLGGCSPSDFVNFITPHGGYSLQRDIAYAPGQRHTLDLYNPETLKPQSPLVVFLYGGGWASGDKADYRFVGQALASRGYATAIPDYRTYPEVRFPSFVEDAAKAVAFLSGRAGERRPILLVGHSAGAQIAALLAFDERYLDAAGMSVCDTIAGFAGLAGPYDFLPLKEERYKQIFPEATRAQSQPIAFVDGMTPPTLLLVGRSDTTVDPGNTRRLAARIEAEGGDVRKIEYDGIGHIGIVGAFARLFRSRAPVLDDIGAFAAGLPMTPPFC
jgi:acetyl esterase/lipase